MTAACLQEGDQLPQLLGALADQVRDVQAAGRALAALRRSHAVGSRRGAVSPAAVAAAVLRPPLQHRDVDAHGVPQPRPRQGAHRLRLRRREQACAAAGGGMLPARITFETGMARTCHTAAWWGG